MGELRHWRSNLSPFPMYSPLSSTAHPQAVLRPQQIEGLYFLGGPSRLHPLAEATGLPPTATAVHPYKAWTVL